MTPLTDQIAALREDQPNMDDHSELVKRLRAMAEPLDGWKVGHAITEAADTLTAQAAEIVRLQADVELLRHQIALNIEERARLKRKTP